MSAPYPYQQANTDIQQVGVSGEIALQLDTSYLRYTEPVRAHARLIVSSNDRVRGLMVIICGGKQEHRCNFSYETENQNNTSSVQ